MRILANGCSLFLLLMLLLFAGISCSPAKNLSVTPAPVQAGAYYFDGWTGKTHHLSPGLRDSFPERQPVWGWVTSTPAAVSRQIDLAADAGLSFFNFCWYYGKDYASQPDQDPLNQALSLYLSAENRSRLKFSLLVANHEGYILGPAEWPGFIRSVMPLLKSQAMVQVEGKPYISFFSAGTLISSFGSTAAVRKALEELRASAVREGLTGITIAVATGPGKRNSREAIACGFDVLTSYNDHDAGFRKGSTLMPVEQLLSGMQKVWNQFRRSDLPYVPAVTLNWDPRPWAPAGKTDVPYYQGYSGQFVQQSIRSVRSWMARYPEKTVKERLVMLYAWNEYGEGAWLTPSPLLKDSLLQGVRLGLGN